MKNIRISKLQNILSENFHFFLVVKCSIYFNRRGFIMNTFFARPDQYGVFCFADPNHVTHT